MKTKILIFFALISLIVGCNNDDDNIGANVSGDYTGNFERNENTSNVELTFNNGTFNGQSEVIKFPALCNGTYTISGDAITFTNECPWTAEFDWSLILSGEWNFNLNNNTLTMTNLNGDKYTLTRQ